jgi:ribosomal protein S18 acetylase RimI-like enzyme
VGPRAAVTALAEVRRARADEAGPVARLLHASGADMYDRFTGGRQRALRVLERAFSEAGNLASSECVWVAEIDGEVAAAMAGFPVDEAARRSRAFLRLALRGSRPWRWPVSLRLYHAGGRASPSPPSSAFYIDALATDERFRRRGAARALLAEAERQARAKELPCVALDTTIPNQAARALYAREGYDEVAYRPGTRGLPGFVALVKRLDRPPLGGSQAMT